MTITTLELLGIITYPLLFVFLITYLFAVITMFLTDFLGMFQ